jgi:isoleucyl-tRNA synthetase
MANDYKDTLNLPKTAFPMKANLSQREPEMLQFWAETAVYVTMQRRKDKQSPGQYILHDGPPYANGHIHMGHALNKILKDIIVKYKSMKGFYSPYVPGWDCHGLPIETQVDKNLGSKKESIEIIEKRRLCKEYAAKFVHIQKEEFKRLGVLGDWENPYLTMSYDYEASIVREFNTFYKNRYVYRGKKPVHWCPSCVTALAEAEVEYDDKESPSIYVKFPLDRETVAHFFPDLTSRDMYVVIWTTTPWTLPANLALAVHPDFEYAAVEQGGEVYVIAEGRLNALKETVGMNGSILAKKKGSELEGMLADHPFLDRKSVVVPGAFVSLEDGTGIVHIAPGHGEDDYQVGLQHGLDIYAPVDDRGIFTSDAAGLEGQFVFKANASIIDILKQKNALIQEEKVLHSYPHCWRCKKPVIFRATEQWFISMEHKALRKNCLDEINHVQWIPHWGRERIFGMVTNRPDWCISRQRSWGVPITLIRCNGCGEYADEEYVLDSIEGLVKQHGADIWFAKREEELLPAEYRCKKCERSDFVKETDILDVWFDSGVSHAAVVRNDDRLQWPADLYLEGSDQHRGWFQSALLASVGSTGKAPYRTVLTHGFVVDGSGKKMSKSLGNVIAPQEIIKSHGAEILRIWVSSEDYRDDIRISKEILSRLTDAYRKIRNTCRFLLGNLADFDYGDYSGNLQEVDRWAMSRLHALIRKVTKAYEHFAFHEVFHSLHYFCVVDMSSFYLDVLKDRLYTERSDSPERRAGQWVLGETLSVLVRLMAPVLSFTAEEVWKHSLLHKKQMTQMVQSKSEIHASVFLSDFPEVDEQFVDDILEERWKDLLKIRDEVNKALELKRAEKYIGNSLEAKVLVTAPQALRKLLNDYGDFLQTFFIVSEVELTDSISDGAYRSTEIEGLAVTVEKASGSKCQRCWNWCRSVGTFKETPEICKRCNNAIA